MATRSTDVFINCPFDEGFDFGFKSIVFAVLACRFRARCAREMEDASEPRIDKLYRLIEQCRYGIHDISRTELDSKNNLPRFNMPFELGLFLGSKRYGGDDQKQKRCLVFDTEAYRYQKFLSDLNGMDISSHKGEPRRMAEIIRNWLVTVSRKKQIPTTDNFLDSYDRFFAGLPEIARAARLKPDTLAYADFERLVLAWVKAEFTAKKLP